MDKDRIIIKETVQHYGTMSVIFGFVGVFILSPIFSPLAFIFGILSISKQEYLAGAIGIIFSIIGVLTSPILMALINMPTITVIHNGVLL
tara:strand:- start:265 stop:534 length:270 start_codon:yes stop_codon:yes gene_type:complete